MTQVGASIAAILLPSSSRQCRIDIAGIQTKFGMSNAAQELLRVILPADSAQPAIFFPRFPSPLFSVLDGVLLVSHGNAVIDVASLSLSLSLSLSRFRLLIVRSEDSCQLAGSPLLDEQSRRK